MRSIGIGAWGEDVTTLQETLNNLGYPVKIDGIFGTETRIAVIKFQEANTDESGAPLMVDGIVGPKSWWALAHASALPNAVATTPQIPTTSKLALVGIVAALIGGYLLLVGNK